MGQELPCTEEMKMSERDQAIERAIQLITRCNTATVVRVADELEDSLEPSPYAILAPPATDDPTGKIADALCEVYD